MIICDGQMVNDKRREKSRTENAKLAEKAANDILVEVPNQRKIQCSNYMRARGKY